MQHLYSPNPTHARIAGWLNLWPDYVALNPSGVNLQPLEQALRLAGEQVRPRLSGPELFELFLRQWN